MSFLQKLVHLQPTPTKPFESFLENESTALPARYRTINELKGTLSKKEIKKSTGADEISVNMTKKS